MIDLLSGGRWESSHSVKTSTSERFEFSTGLAIRISSGGKVPSDKGETIKVWMHEDAFAVSIEKEWPGGHFSFSGKFSLRILDNPGADITYNMVYKIRDEDSKLWLGTPIKWPDKEYVPFRHKVLRSKFTSSVEGVKSILQFRRKVWKAEDELAKAKSAGGSDLVSLEGRVKKLHGIADESEVDIRRNKTNGYKG